MTAAPAALIPRQLSDVTLVSVVLPAFNESAVLRELHARVSAALREYGCRYEIIFVNDGSTDDSSSVLDQLAREDAGVRVLHFSRNFGHQAAVQAGLDAVRGDAVIIMDSDLQDDPAAAKDFLRLWQQGYDVIYAVRHARKEHAVKRFLFYAFYRVLNSISSTKIPMDAGNFSLLDRAVVQQLQRLPERDRYLPGLRSWIGFRQIGLPVERGRRHDEHPRVSLAGLFRLAKTAIFSFSSVPLSAFYVISLLSLLTCLGVAAFTLYHKLLTGLATPGWASQTIVASFFGSLNALGIGILGEYAIRIYDQVRARPTYVVARAVNFATPRAKTDEDVLLDWLAENWHGTSAPDQEDSAAKNTTRLQLSTRRS